MSAPDNVLTQHLHRMDMNLLYNIDVTGEEFMAKLITNHARSLDSETVSMIPVLHLETMWCIYYRR